MTGLLHPASIIVSSSTSAAGGFDLYTSIGLGVGGIFVAVALVYLLAYLDLLDALRTDDEAIGDLKMALVAAAIPLFVTFGGIVLYRSLVVIGSHL